MSNAIKSEFFFPNKSIIPPHTGPKNPIADLIEIARPITTIVVSKFLAISGRNGVTIWYPVKIAIRNNPNSITSIATVPVKTLFLLFFSILESPPTNICRLKR